MKVEFDLNDNFVDDIVIKSLKDQYDSLLNDFENPGGIFDLDPKKDKVKLKKLINSIAEVYNWYTPPSENLKGVV